MNEAKMLAELARDEARSQRGREHRRRQASTTFVKGVKPTQLAGDIRKEIKKKCYAYLCQWVNTVPIGTTKTVSGFEQDIRAQGIEHNKLRSLLNEALSRFHRGNNQIPLKSANKRGLYYRMAFPFTTYTGELLGILSARSDCSSAFSMMDIALEIEKDRDPTLAPINGAKAIHLTQFAQDKQHCPAILEQYHGNFRLTEFGLWLTHPEHLPDLLSQLPSHQMIQEANQWLNKELKNSSR